MFVEFLFDSRAKVKFSVDGDDKTTARSFRILSIRERRLVCDVVARRASLFSWDWKWIGGRRQLGAVLSMNGYRVAGSLEHSGIDGRIWRAALRAPERSHSFLLLVVCACCVPIQPAVCGIECSSLLHVFCRLALSSVSSACGSARCVASVEPCWVVLNVCCTRVAVFHCVCVGLWIAWEQSLLDIWLAPRNV